MRILFISASPIRKEISIGNTFLNLFSDLENVEFASIYTKAGEADPAISQSFCITEKMLVQNFLGKGPAGKGTKDKVTPTTKTADSSESAVKHFARTKRWRIFFLAQNLLWVVGRWKSQELRQFVEEYQPDVIFTVLSEKIYINRLILYVKKIANKSLVVYAWDNNYSLKRMVLSPFDWLGHFFNRHYMRRVAKKADKLYVISDVQKKDYEKAFRKSCTVITKAEDFSEEPQLKNTVSMPVQLLYTGNLYANRWKSLGMLANVLKRINRDGIKAQLRIYTATPVTEKMRKALAVDETSFLLGSVSAEEVQRIQTEADILVHAEATDLKNRLTVRQSFSTKIVDYLKKARPIVAIGSKKVASIKHLMDHNAAIVADNEQELYEKLIMIIQNPKCMQEYAVRAYMCGRKCHDKAQQKAMLEQDLRQLSEISFKI